MGGQGGSKSLITSTGQTGPFTHDLIIFHTPPHVGGAWKINNLWPMLYGSYKQDIAYMQYFTFKRNILTDYALSLARHRLATYLSGC